MIVILKTEIKNNVQLQLNKFQKSTDISLQTAKDDAMSISFNNNMKDFVSKLNSEKESEIYFSAYLLKKELLENSYQSINNSLIYIYIPCLNSVLYNTGLINVEIFYEHYLQNSDISYDDWRIMLNNISKSGYYLLHKNENNSFNDYQAYYCYDIPYNKYNSRKIFIISEVNMTQSSILANELKSLYNAEIILSSSGGTIDDQYVLDETDFKRKYITISSTSAIDNFVYHLVIEHNDMLYKVRYILKFMIAGGIVYLALSIILSIIFLQINYKPLHKIIIDFVNDSKIMLSKNEYSILRNNFENIYEEQTNLKNRISTQNRILQRHLFARTIKGEYIGTDILNTMNSYNATFPSNKYFVVVYSTDVNSIEDNMLNNIIVNTIESEFSKLGYCIAVNIDLLFVGLIFIDETISDTLKSKFLDIAKTCKRIFNKFSNKMDLFAASDVYSNLNLINVAYNEASITIEHALIVGQTDLIFYKDAKSDIKERMYFYTPDVESRLIAAVLTGDRENSIRITDDIFNEMQKQVEAGIFPILAKSFRILLTSTLIKAVGIAKKNSTNTEFPIFNWLNAFQPLHNIDSMKAFFNSCIEKIIISTSIKDTNKYDELINNVIMFIDENYSNTELNVSMIADKFGYSPSYIGMLFREIKSFGIIDYINETRIKKAKMLISGGITTNIKQLSKSVGYFSSPVFIRNFKKYAGMTPSQYKTLSKQIRNYG